MGCVQCPAERIGYPYGMPWVGQVSRTVLRVRHVVTWAFRTHVRSETVRGDYSDASRTLGSHRPSTTLAVSRRAELYTNSS